MDWSKQAVLSRDGSLKKTHTLVQCLENTGRKLPYTRTLPKSIGVKFHLLICLRAVFPAKTSATQVKEPESKKELEVDYGKSIGKPFAYFDRESYSWRMFQHSLTEGLILFSQIWPRSGMMRNGIVYPRVPLARLTKETESGLWPTPTTQESEHPTAQLNENNRRISKTSSSSHGLNLADTVKRWPTPTTSDSHNPMAGVSGGSPRLSRLRENVRFSLGIEKEPLKSSGQLNPAWVEWLMGFPIGWTELNVSEMQLFLKSRSSGRKESKN